MKQDQQDKIIRELEMLLQYYNRTRGMGHTYSAIHGVKNNEKALLVIINNYMGKLLDVDDRWITLERLYHIDNVGMQRPLVIDNFTMIHLLSMPLMLIQALIEDKKNLTDGLLLIREEPIPRASAVYGQKIRTMTQDWLEKVFGHKNWLVKAVEFVKGK